MGRPRDKLSALQIRKAAPGRLIDGGGLHLDRTETGGKWTFRYSFQGKRRDMGLGTWPETGLQEARAARDRWVAVLQSGRDPIEARRRQLAEEAAARDRRDPTVEDATGEAFAAIRAGLRGDGDRGRWLSPLRLHVLPRIGKRRIADLDADAIRAALAPIWRTKHPTAEKALQRLGIVIRHAATAGIACDPGAVDRARVLLGQVRHETQGIAWTPWQDVPGLFARLDSPAASTQCLRLIILTAVRGHAARGMLFSEVSGDVWTVPPDRIKGREGKVAAFRVPLSAPALDVIRTRARYAQDDRVFPSYRAGSISATAIEKVMRDMGEAGRPHGLRKSFRTWVQDTEACSFDVAETILGHRLGGTVERTYAQSDLLDLRRAALDRWAEFVTGSKKHE